LRHVNGDLKTPNHRGRVPLMLEKPLNVVGSGPWRVEFRLDGARGIEDLLYRAGLQACQVILCRKVRMQLEKFVIFPTRRRRISP
jgi:hypothetical protein